MVNLVFDIGNTFAKVAVFEEQHILWTKRYRQITEKLLQQILVKFKPATAIISSVQNKIFLWEAMLEKQIRTFRLQYQMAKSIKNHYQQPEKLMPVLALPTIWLMPKEIITAAVFRPD